MNPLDIIKKYYPESSEAYHILTVHSRSVADKALEIARRHPELNLDLTFEDDVLNINSATYTPIYIYENPNVRYHKFKLIDMEDAILKYESSKDTSIGQSLYNTLKSELNNITKIVGDEIY